MFEFLNKKIEIIGLSGKVIRFGNGGITNQVMIIHPNNYNELSSQLLKLTGNDWNDSYFKSADGGNLSISNPFIHKETGKIFFVGRKGIKYEFVTDKDTGEIVVIGDLIKEDEWEKPKIEILAEEEKQPIQEEVVEVFDIKNPSLRDRWIKGIPFEGDIVAGVTKDGIYFQSHYPTNEIAKENLGRVQKEYGYKIKFIKIIPGLREIPEPKYKEGEIIKLKGYDELRIWKLNYLQPDLRHIVGFKKWYYEQIGEMPKGEWLYELIPSYYKIPITKRRFRLWNETKRTFYFYENELTRLVNA